MAPCWMDRRYGLAGLGTGLILMAAGWVSPAGAEEIIRDPLKDPIALLEFLEQHRADLESQRKRQELREGEMVRMRDKIETRISVLETLRQAIETDLDKEKEIDEANVQRLAKIYSNMKPKVSANQLRALDRETAIRVLKAMSERKAAKVLMFMDKSYSKDAVELGNELGIPISERRRRDR